MTVPTMMMTLMKITIIITVIVFHADDIYENHHNHHHDCLSKLSVLGPCERLLGRVGRATFLIFEQYGWVEDKIVLMC